MDELIKTTGCSHCRRGEQIWKGTQSTSKHCAIQGVGLRPHPGDYSSLIGYPDKPGELSWYHFETLYIEFKKAQQIDSL